MVARRLGGQPVRKAGRGSELAPPRYSPYAGQQLSKAEGLDDEVIGSELEAHDPVHLRAPGAQDDDRDGRARAQLAAYVIAVHIRQPKVQEDEVSSRRSKCVCSVGDPRDIEALPRETFHQGVCYPVVVFDHQQSHSLYSATPPGDSTDPLRGGLRKIKLHGTAVRAFLIEALPLTCPALGGHPSNFGCMSPVAAGAPPAGTTTSRPRRQATPGRAQQARVASPPPAWQVTVASTALGLGLGATIATGFINETASELRASGGVLMFLGGETGLAGTYLALVMVLLVSRVPFVERVIGQDGLLRWHKRLAPWPIALITAHAVLLVFAYAAAAHTGVWHETTSMIGGFPWMVEATVGLVLMLAVATVSVKFLRSRLQREKWWTFHLLMYVALALSFAHVIALGPSFVGHPAVRAAWVAFWVLTAGSVAFFRFGLPVWRTLRHGLRVVEVRQEAAGVISVICEGRNLDRLRVSGGQFFEWRFLCNKMWWQAHPFTLSAKPAPPYLRLTVKGIGDFSKALSGLRPGTRVAIEGPYGVFTAHSRQRRKALLIAGGIGITAVRALLEDLSPATEPVVVVRATSPADLALMDEVHELLSQRRGRAHELIGPREAIRMEKLGQLVPDLRKRDVYVAGPPLFVQHVVSIVGRMGVQRDAVHFEEYALA